MFLHHMTATLQLQIHIVREIKIYGNYKKHTQTAKNDFSFCCGQRLLEDRQLRVWDSLSSPGLKRLRHLIKYS